MNNVLSNLARSMFPSRDQEQQRMSPSPEMLGAGLASNAASKSLRKEYQTKLALAQANDEEFPSFEEWIIQRR